MKLMNNVSKEEKKLIRKKCSGDPEQCMHQ